MKLSGFAPDTPEMILSQVFRMPPSPDGRKRNLILTGKTLINDQVQPKIGH